MAVVKIPNASLRAMLDALVDRMDAGAGAGYFRIYTGTQPADPDGAATGTLLAQCTASDPAFGSASDTVGDATVTANAISDDTAANATGTAGYFRAFDSNGNTIFQGDVTAVAGGGTMEIDNTSITINGNVSIDSCVIMMSET
jgi:hypothetical protein